MTLNEKYYEINRRLNSYLLARGIKAPVYKYGVDIATLKTSAFDPSIKYPYFQSAIVGDVKQNSRTSRASGVMTYFDYQLNFFAGPRDEFQNDAAFFYPFEVAKNIFTDTTLQLFADLMSVVSTTGPYNWDIKSGQVMPSASIVYHIQTVCSYAAQNPPAPVSTDIDSAVNYPTALIV